MIKICPSILSADFSNLEKELKALDAAGADMIHIDVMDGHFVPNLTFGPPLIKSIKKHSNLPFDVHLMIKRPENSIKSYIEAGADFITVHPESTIHLDRVINEIKNNGAKAGISLLPTTDIANLDYIFDKIDLVLVMAVNPGFGGQEFIPNQLRKINKLSTKIKKINRQIIISVDGGINDRTAKECVNVGANALVSGSYIFGGNYADRIKRLRSCAAA